MNAHPAQLRHDAPRRLLSVRDLSRMIKARIIGDDENVELIDGELIQMAAKGFAHEFMKAGLVRLFVEQSSADVFVGIEASLRLDTHTLVEPDILLARRSEVVPGPEGYITIPGRDLLLLVEVSDTTLRKDRVLKAELYARYAVPEYWIVDTRKRLIWRHTEPDRGTYSSVVKIAESEYLTPLASDLAGATVRLADLAP